MTKQTITLPREVIEQLMDVYDRLAEPCWMTRIVEAQKALRAALADEQAQPAQEIDWAAVGRIIDAHDARGQLMTGTSNWAAKIYRAAVQSNAERVPLTDEHIRKWWASENGLEDCEMCKLDDFTQVVRAIEAEITKGQP